VRDRSITHTHTSRERLVRKRLAVAHSHATYSPVPGLAQRCQRAAYLAERGDRHVAAVAEHREKRVFRPRRLRSATITTAGYHAAAMAGSVNLLHEYLRFRATCLESSELLIAKGNRVRKTTPLSKKAQSRLYWRSRSNILFRDVLPTSWTFRITTDNNPYYSARTPHSSCLFLSMN